MVLTSLVLLKYLIIFEVPLPSRSREQYLEMNVRMPAILVEFSATADSFWQSRPYVHEVDIIPRMDKPFPGLQLDAKRVLRIGAEDVIRGCSEFHEPGADDKKEAVQEGHRREEKTIRCGAVYLLEQAQMFRLSKFPVDHVPSLVWKRMPITRTVPRLVQGG